MVPILDKKNRRKIIQLVYFQVVQIIEPYWQDRKKNDTNNLKIDYIKDGYDKDKVRFPTQANSMHIFDIDELVSKESAYSVINEAPYMSWIYIYGTQMILVIGKVR